MYNKGDYLTVGKNEPISSEFITSLSFQHLFNCISIKDTKSNRVIDGLTKEYNAKIDNVFNNSNSPLSYFIDEIEDLFLYTKNHITNIINKPRSAIIKVECLLPKEKITNVDSKMFRWLANKPGNTFREKLSNVSKVKATKKVYSYDIKENQVFLSYLLLLKDYFEDKKVLIEQFPLIFGLDSSNLSTINSKISFITKAIRKFKDLYPDVKAKNFSTPNNALINDEQYSPIWKSYRYIRTSNFDNLKLENIKKKLLNVLFHCVRNLICNSELIQISDFPQKYDEEINKSIIFINENNFEIFDISFSDDSIKVKNKKVDLTNKTENSSIQEFQVEILESSNFERGLPFKIDYRGETQNFYFDLKGIKESAFYIYKFLNLKQKINDNIPNEKSIVHPFISINDYSNRILSSKDKLSINVNYEGASTYLNNNKLFVITDNLLTAHKLLDDDISKSSYLHYLKPYIKNEYVLYDVSDVLDEFSSSSLRNSISSTFLFSYPIWRSVLGGETVGDLNISNVFDCVGDEFYVSSLEHKKDLFVHVGPTLIKSNMDIPSEKDFLEMYLQEYVEEYKYTTLGKENINKIIESGILQKILILKGEAPVIVLNNRTTKDEIYLISFDAEIFNKVKAMYVSKINRLISLYDQEVNCLIIPDYLDKEDFNCDYIIHNQELFKGSLKILKRLEAGKTTWYEKLPNLSLEIVKNGLWDDLCLTKNREEENIIGKSISIDVNDIFTLIKGQDTYRLPLRKSFIGESNKDYSVVLKDKSFPLKENVDVKLKLIYQYGSANAYDLIFTPVGKAPFKEIKAVWEETQNRDVSHLFFPEIKDIELTAAEAADKYSKVLRDLRELQYPSFNWREYKFFDRIANQAHRLYGYSNEYKTKIINDAKPVVPIIKKWLDSLHSDYANDLKKGKETPFYKFKIAVLEELLSTLTLDIDLIKTNYFVFPENVYGRYLGTESDNKVVIKELYKFMSNMSFSKERNNRIINKRVFEYPELYKVDTLICRLTAASAINHKFLLQVYESDAITAKEISKHILSLMRLLKNGKFQDCQSESIYAFSSVVELLFSFLFLRNKVGLETYLPNGKGAQEIIYCLKEFNRNYSYLKEHYSPIKGNNDKDNLPFFKTKLRFSNINKPDELYKVPNDIYILYLFLSGDEQAGKVTINVDDGNKQFN